jgi:hypothetical protein
MRRAGRSRDDCGMSLSRATKPPLSGARPGDRLIVSAHHQGEPERDGEILEVRGPGGTPPYVVRWEDTGAVAILYPGSDARVQRFRARA